MADRGDYDIVLTDLVMPKMDGLDLLSHFKQRKPRTKVIMITAFGTIESAVEAMRRGATDYIAKPFRMDEIEASIDRALEEARFTESVKTKHRVAWESLDEEVQEVIDSLANPIRHGVIKFLEKEDRSSFTGIKKSLKIEDPTKLSFHLRKLRASGLIEQDADKIYYLSDKGIKVAGILEQLKVEIR
jgi:YesN/AraC family two-component response regulator